jgi:nicotinate-nucleotide--dimethylbenzimidazole phosphoribosyltransferase
MPIRLRPALPAALLAVLAVAGCATPDDLALPPPSFAQAESPPAAAPEAPPEAAPEPQATNVAALGLRGVPAPGGAEPLAAARPSADAVADGGSRVGAPPTDPAALAAMLDAAAAAGARPTPPSDLPSEPVSTPDPAADAADRPPLDAIAPILLAAIEPEIDVEAPSHDGALAAEAFDSLLAAAPEPAPVALPDALIPAPVAPLPEPEPSVPEPSVPEPAFAAVIAPQEKPAAIETPPAEHHAAPSIAPIQLASVQPIASDPATEVAAEEPVETSAPEPRRSGAPTLAQLTAPCIYEAPDRRRGVTEITCR